MPIGNLTAFLTYILQILLSVMMAVMMVDPAASGGGERGTRSKRCSCTSRRSPTPRPRLRPRRPARGVLKDVGFGYPGGEQPVLHGISLHLLAPGETSAIIGGTGSGKTTLLNLIPRFFDATARQRAGQRPRRARAGARGPLWARIGLVPQPAFLFSGTVAEQPALRPPGGERGGALARPRGRPGARLRRRHAGRPRGPDRPRRHERLRAASGSGCRSPARSSSGRRLPLRRLLLGAGRRYRRPAPRRLRSRDGDAAVVIVAQRVSTIMHADRIIVLDDGRVVGSRPARGAAGHLRPVPGDRRVTAR